MSDYIKATFYEDGTVYVDNTTTGRSTSFNEDTPLRAKLAVLGISSVSEQEVEHFRLGWAIAQNSDTFEGSRVEYALNYAFGLSTRKDFELPTAIGSVVNVDIGSEIIVITLGKDGLWREGSMIYSAEAILKEAEEVIVIA